MKIHKVFKIFCHCLTRKATTEYNFIRSIHFFGKQVREMDVNEIPIPAVATIKVSKEGKSAVFDTTVIQTTDNKYIYVMPVRRDKKLVSFEGEGLMKEIRIQFDREDIYSWRNIWKAKICFCVLKRELRVSGLQESLKKRNRKKAVNRLGKA